MKVWIVLDEYDEITFVMADREAAEQAILHLVGSRFEEWKVGDGRFAEAGASPAPEATSQCCGWLMDAKRSPLRRGHFPWKGEKA
jgi:hypothetical protein